MSPDETGLVSWRSLTADWKKFCWILEAARLKKVDGLANSEVSYLIGKVFREVFHPRLVNNLKGKIKAGVAKSVSIRSGDKDYIVWKILSVGSNEVKHKPLKAPEADETKG